MNGNVEKFDTTIGELVVALSDVAFEVCADKEEAYFLVALALKSLLARAQVNKAPYLPLLFARGCPLSESAPLTFISSGTCA